jgi:hypothetical protein
VGLQEPIDQRLLRCDYSDVAVLGKAVTRGRSWRAAGLAIHVLNGALFGLAFHEARRILPAEPRKLAIGMAVAEHESATSATSGRKATPNAGSRRSGVRQSPPPHGPAGRH